MDETQQPRRLVEPYRPRRPRSLDGGRVMGTLMLAIGCFSGGMLLGLVFGPAKERLESARINGFIEGWNASKKLPAIEEREGMW